MFSGKNQVESRVVRMFWNDGLLDILAGCGVLLIGIAWLCDLVPLGAIAPALLLPFWRPLRARLTEPRLGYVEFSDTQQRRNRNFLLFAIALGVVSLLAAIGVYAVVVNGMEILNRRTVPALPACIIGLLALMTATITAQSRFVIYALALGLCGAAVAALQWEPGWALLAGGVATVVGGLLTLTRFLNRYPLPLDAK